MRLFQTSFVFHSIMKFKQGEPWRVAGREETKGLGGAEVQTD